MVVSMLGRNPDTEKSLLNSKGDLNGDKKSPKGSDGLTYGYRDLYPNPIDPTDIDGSKSKAAGIFDPYWTITASEPFDVDEFVGLVRQGRRVLRKKE